MEHLHADTVFKLLVSLAVILASAELFTNGVEWLGRRLSLAEGAVGSVLAAVGTALPETLIPFVAILIAGGETGRQIGLGAILGAPFMLATLAMFITGLAAIVFARRRPAGATVILNRAVVTRDLGFFLVMYAAAVATSFAPGRFFHLMVCLGLLAAYALYLRRTFADPSVADGEVGALRFQRLLARWWWWRRRPGEDAVHCGEWLESVGNGAPRLRVILGQVLVALAGIVGGAYIFVGAAEETARALGVAPLLVALVIAPVATELPEKFNSIVWMRQGKDTYAVGNITGAMVFQSSFPVSLGLAFTSWRLAAAAGEPQRALYSVALALAGGLWLLAATRLAPREMTAAGDDRPLIRLHPAVLLAGGALYATFLFLLIKGI
ncbi:MAG TPA: sodium:calcium antiporter [Armatimonadota bacterium]|nr:sodium:calcium antiporter [Armatimonadota bacterium]